MTVQNRRLRAAGLAAIVALLAAACGTGASGTGALAAAGSPRAGSVLEAARAAGVLRVANTQANPPYSFVDASNTVVGFDVDVANEIARRIGIGKVEFVAGTFQSFIPGLQTDKWDAVISGLTVTDERRQQVAFSCPYQVNGVSIFVADGDTAIRSQADLAGKRVAVTAGGTQEKQARAIPGVDVLTYDNSTLALSDVAIGRSDAYLGSRFTGAYLAQQNRLPVRPVEGLLSKESNAMAFPKGADDLVAAANTALTAMEQDGTLSTISRRWLGGLDVVRDLPTGRPC